MLHLVDLLVRIEAQELTVEMVRGVISIRRLFAIKSFFVAFGEQCGVLLLYFICRIILVRR